MVLYCYVCDEDLTSKKFYVNPYGSGMLCSDCWEYPDISIPRCEHCYGKSDKLLINIIGDDQYRICLKCWDQALDKNLSSRCKKAQCGYRCKLRLVFNYSIAVSRNKILVIGKWVLGTSMYLINK